MLLPYFRYTLNHQNLTIMKKFISIGIVSMFAGLLAQGVQAQNDLFDTEEEAMMRGVTKHIKNGWHVDPVFTVGETDNEGTDYAQENFGYRPTGVMDGMYAFRKATGKIDLVVNHELQDGRGYPYQLANGTMLTGARVSKFRIEQKSGNIGVRSVGLAYDKIYDRYYDEVTDQSQLDEGANPGSLDGMDRLCSASGIEKGKFGFADNIFFTGEETGNGQEFALDVDKEVLYCAPAMGRAAWESVCIMDNYGSDKVVVLVGDDRGGTPLLLYVGEKGSSFTNQAPMFLKKNGLAKGNLYVWVADNGDLTPEDWNGTGTSRTGTFVKIEQYNASMAGQAGYDAAGWADQDTQDAAGIAVNRFNFSRPEDVATNPHDGSQAIFASTGRSSLYPSDAWGTTYLVDIDESVFGPALQGPLAAINNFPAEITIVYDGDDAGAGQFANPDEGLRSPDNLEWAENGYVYINEDRSIGGFCLDSGKEASVWQLNPQNGELIRILEMDRSSVPFEQEDSAPGDCGNWESSGTIDVSRFFHTKQNETLLALVVQAHSNDDDVKEDSPIGGDDDLSEGGQLIFVSNVVEPIASGYAPSNGNGYKKYTDNATGLVLSPNPANEVLNLSAKTAYEVYNFSGTLVLEGEAANSINVSSLKPGIYVLKAENGETAKFKISRN